MLIQEASDRGLDSRERDSTEFPSKSHLHKFSCMSNFLHNPINEFTKLNSKSFGKLIWAYTNGPLGTAAVETNQHYVSLDFLLNFKA